MKKYNLSPGDFPDIADFKSKLAEHDFSKFNALKPRLIEDADNVLGIDFPRLMEALPRSMDAGAPKSLVPTSPVEPIAVEPALDASNPFGDDEEGDGWILDEYVAHYTPEFQKIQQNGFINGSQAKTVLGSTGVPTSSLRKVWELSDIDKDGQLDFYEYIVAMYLIDQVKSGNTLPAALEPEYIPPSKR